MEIVYTPTFIRQYKKLILPLQEEIKEKIHLFQEDQNHPSLKTHKLKGRLTGRYSFSVNYNYRIIFHYLSKKSVALVAVGDHDIYKA